MLLGIELPEIAPGENRLPSRICADPKTGRFCGRMLARGPPPASARISGTLQDRACVIREISQLIERAARAALPLHTLNSRPARLPRGASIPPMPAPPTKNGGGVPLMFAI
jgi:hypothetical protein